MFQSTRPRGARRGGCGSGENAECFNPRARAGRDNDIIRSKEVKWCFNPRARAGRDAPDPNDKEGDKCFNPRARAGRDVI